MSRSETSTAEIGRSDQVYGPPMHKRNICWNPYGRGDIHDIYWNPPATTTTRHHLPNCPCELAYEQSYEKDLIYSKKRIRNIRIVLGVIGAIVLIGLITVAVVLVVNSSEANDLPSAQTGNGIKLDDILTGKLQARRFNGSWSTGTNIIYRDLNNIYEYNVAKGKQIKLWHDDKLQYLVFEKSADEKYLLLGKNHLKIFRHSFQAEYDIVDLETGAVHPLKIKGNQEHLYLVQWAPIGNALIINFERNLYYKPTAMDSDEIQLTTSTSPTILNGIPDWVYEEEVFGTNSAVWFNPNGTKIAFIQFDDSPTKLVDFQYYGEAGDLRYQYPWNQHVAYPKAGSPNPFVKLFTADLQLALKSNDFLTEVPVPSALNTQSHIITVVTWLNDQNVLSVWMNRIQNAAYVQVFEGLRRAETFSIESKTGWVDLFTEPLRNRDGSEVALLLPHRQESDGNFRHISLLSTKNANGAVLPITSGKYVVTAVLHWDAERNIIFYTANTENASNSLHVYAIKAAKDQKPQCLTCKLVIDGLQQTYFGAEFSKENYVVISALGPGVPSHTIFEWSYTNGEVILNKVYDWELNTNLKNELSTVSMPVHEVHTINIANGFTAKVLLQLPPNIDRSGDTKYPMLVDVYGGPDSYSVIDKWSMDWGTYLSSNQSVIYAKIDGRGTGLRGDNLLHSIYLKLGTVEITDQIEVTKSLHQKLPYIDANRTGIWGWSYGGYAAAMALANDQSGTFKCAASIAPVTDWAYYDSIYTERYMGVPDDNPQGYANSRLSTLAMKFKGKKFLLVHGTLDDNVHYQQAMVLAKNLERRDILFKQISYPDEDHGLAGVRPHLYHSLDKFFGECFNIKRLSKWGRK
ncbi:venom dipeptidyl peptidase 4 isoform X2 [Eupeodes corollae]|uniref:venom dipeptidyl peptidase 4 isoform X2 n=1 Tax=Eupeodes corollae TaxID=290404 RepID=UPI0024915521|nr:venom dipeptidyl peptidase 4 isoform X2 [Eupeodes corollae]XP_055907460.1 venom dipeptidyl peptidase 4 isoform X2 [Eupeodes corollae]XP_055907461.1 venom dipeptidyl peptidase 4 isoform X2 [Eupeodes corollae]XP_055907462.1 venom dipeptidyl peptidase 4 isoform X2 [Eupeodes corollae]